MSNSPVSVPTTPTAGAKALQERLNYLISRLSASIGVIKTWPSTDGDDASIHVKTTSKLISTILETKRALEKVEGTIKADAELRKSLQNCPVPINLLDLLDHGDGLNPGMCVLTPPQRKKFWIMFQAGGDAKFCPSINV